MDDDLEARLESHAKAFEGLLSLIPAKDYFGQDNSDQWQRKKQTKEEKKAARKAKLDPANRKSALDVIQENERKRKRELGIEDEAGSEVKVEQSSRPIKKAKTAKVAPKAADEASDAAKTKAEKRKEKRERKKEKADRQKMKAEAKKAKKVVEKEGGDSADVPQQNVSEDDDEVDEVDDDDVEMDFAGLADDTASNPSTAPTSPNLDSPPFDVSATHSTTSSSSSIVPPAEQLDISNDALATSTKMLSEDTTAIDAPIAATIPPTKPAKQKAFTMPEIDKDTLQARLKARLDELRAKRKADGPDGQPAKSRQDLLEARRKKSEARKKHKKELRAQAKAEEDRINQERLQGSGSPLSADIFSPRSPARENNFSFGRVAFEDGTAADAGLSGLQDARQKKGPRDLKGALEAATKKENRLKSLDDAKRQDIQEKDVWLKAKQKAHGERVKDDTSLLKKALKRREKQKGKSEKMWNERKEGVEKGQAMRQKKREENLAKRKEEKGSKGKKGKGKPAGKPAKKKGRPGFEGK